MPKRSRTRINRSKAAFTAEALTVPLTTRAGSSETQLLPPPFLVQASFNPNACGFRDVGCKRVAPVSNGHEYPGIIVGHDKTFELKLIAQHMIQKPRLRASRDTVDRIVCMAKRPLSQSCPSSNSGGGGGGEGQRQQQQQEEKGWGGGEQHEQRQRLLCNSHEHMTCDALASATQALKAGK
eukprot:COSAG05_NODE_934_length_6536_cov_9.161100_4_plen_181_part_00